MLFRSTLIAIGFRLIVLFFDPLVDNFASIYALFLCFHIVYNLGDISVILY